MPAELTKSCWEYLNCDGARREQCPAFTRGQGTTCWEAAGKYCPDLATAYGRDGVKCDNCDNCRYYQYRHDG